MANLGGGTVGGGVLRSRRGRDAHPALRPARRPGRRASGSTTVCPAGRGGCCSPTSSTSGGRRRSRPARRRPVGRARPRRGRLCAQRAPLEAPPRRRGRGALGEADAAAGRPWVDVEAARGGLHRAESAARVRTGRAPGALPAWRSTSASGASCPARARSGRASDVGRLDALLVRALELVGIAALHIGGGERATAERAARRLVELAPLRESGTRLLMEVLATEGNRAEALVAYETLRRCLRDELGVAPSAETQALRRPARLTATLGSCASPSSGTSSGSASRGSSELRRRRARSCTRPTTGSRRAAAAAWRRSSSRCSPTRRTSSRRSATTSSGAARARSSRSAAWSCTRAPDERPHPLGVRPRRRRRASGRSRPSGRSCARAGTTTACPGTSSPTMDAVLLHRRRRRCARRGTSRARAHRDDARARERSVVAAVALDALIGSGEDEAERYHAGDLDPEPELVVTTSGALGGWMQPGGPFVAAPSPRARSSTPTARATRSWRG